MTGHIESHLPKNETVLMKIALLTGQIKNWTNPLKIKILQSQTIDMWGVYSEALD